MWHKPCRTFHPWCLCIKTRCLFNPCFACVLHIAKFYKTVPPPPPSPETLNSGQNREFFVTCDLDIWWMTLKNNRAPFLSNIKLCASFHRHMWIQTGVTVWKRLSWVFTSVTLIFDLWPWPFAWTSLLSMVISPENFMMIRWQEHNEKGVTDGRKKVFLELLGRS